MKYAQSAWLFVFEWLFIDVACQHGIAVQLRKNMHPKVLNLILNDLKQKNQQRYVFINFKLNSISNLFRISNIPVHPLLRAKRDFITLTG